MLTNPENGLVNPDSWQWGRLISPINLLSVTIFVVSPSYWWRSLAFSIEIGQFESWLLCFYLTVLDNQKLMLLFFLLTYSSLSQIISGNEIDSSYHQDMMIDTYRFLNGWKVKFVWFSIDNIRWNLHRKATKTWKSSLFNQRGSEEWTLSTTKFYYKRKKIALLKSWNL